MVTMKKEFQLQNTDIQAADIALNRIKTLTSKDWEKVKEKNMLELFHKAATEVPAYKAFLEKREIDHAKIKTFADFQKVPFIFKKNYLRRYPLQDLEWKGTLNRPHVFTSTSGSTGDPFYFSRSEELDWQYSLMHELFFNNGDTKKSTLVLVGFGMGVWIGGTITYKAYEMLGLRRGHPISVLPTGINKVEIFKALKKLAPKFDQTILIGYAPFIKDLIDEAPEWGVDMKKLNIRMTFAAEAFTETFRSYLAKKVAMKNVCLDTMNIYGTADIGAVAFETPLSILMRRIAVKKPELFKDIFTNTQKTPTLAQYMPDYINIEYVNDEILLTGNNTMPLVRYAIGDQGGVYTYDQLVAKFEKHGVDLAKEIKDAGIQGGVAQLPFVYVYERNDMSTTLYGLQIYPETVREVLIKSPFNKYFTGKFTLFTKFDDKHNQYLEINLEMQKNKKINKLLKSTLLNSIIKNLLEKNSEYRELYKFIKGRSHPRLVFWPAEDPIYFKPGVKQSWVKKVVNN